jgi:transcriptional regulator with XRE-family HTH domain
MREEEALPIRLRRLRKAVGLSVERLAHATYRNGHGLTFSAIAQFERGETRPKLETIELLAEALGVSPMEFPEYRLAIARRLFDEREVGLDQAVGNLEALEGGEPLLDRVAREVEQQGSAASPSAKNESRRSTRKASGRRKRA